MDKIFDISIFIHPLETAKILRNFQKKVAEVQSQIRIKGREGIGARPDAGHSLSRSGRFARQLQQAQEKMFDVGIYITIYADNEAELDQS